MLPIRTQIYMCTLAIAHLGEYLFVASFHTAQLKWDSYLINQSKFYILAHTIAINEYVLRYFFAPQLQLLAPFEYWFRKVTLVVGLGFIVVGHAFRLGAMFTAAKSFHHLV